MPRLSTDRITSFVGDIYPLSLLSDEGAMCDGVSWRVAGDAVSLRSFNDGGEYAFSGGVLVIFNKPGAAEIIATLDGAEYFCHIEASPMITATEDDELHYFIGDMHDHTSSNHNPKEFATHEYGKIEDYVRQIEDENLIDFGVISDHAGVTNDYDFFRGFEISRDAENQNVIVFAGAESEITYTEEDRFDILHRLSGEIVTINSAGYCDVANFTEFSRGMEASPRAIAIFAHPHVVGFSTNGIWNFNFRRNNTPELLRIARGVEMGNGADRKENLLHEYAFSAALDAGFRVSTTCSSDSHGPKWGYYIMPGKTVIMAKEKSREAFLDALLSNRFYATESGNVKLKYSVNGKTAPADLEPTNSYEFKISLDYFKEDLSTAPVICQIISDYGKCVCESDIAGMSEFVLTVHSDTARYFYLRLIDSVGRKTWSTPVWCGRAFDELIEPEIDPIEMSECVATADGKDASAVINGNPMDTWYADSTSATVTIDMGKERAICALGYYPHIILRGRNKVPEWTTSMESAGLVSKYQILASIDGVDYTELANGVCQTLGSENIISFTKTRARYIRFVALSTVGADSMLPKYASSTVRIANLSLFEPKKK